MKIRIHPKLHLLKNMSKPDMMKLASLFHPDIDFEGESKEYLQGVLWAFPYHQIVKKIKQIKDNHGKES